MGMSGNSTKPSVISIKHLFVAYDQTDILRDVSLEITEGVFLPLLGPNGAGKTTLLRAILGLIKPRKGKIETTLKRSDFGYVPQHGAIDPLYPVTTEQIVLMGLYPKLGPWRRLKGPEKERVISVLEDLDLLEHATKTFGELSGGMKQKALIARALVADPKVLVLDEPTSELDEGSGRETMMRLANLSKDHGTTVLLAHHALEMAKNLATRLCLVDHGSVLLVDAEEIRGERR